MRQLLTILLVFISVGVQAQSLKGYTLREPLGNRSAKIKTTVAEIEGTLSVETTIDGKIKVLDFISSKECSLSELHDFALLVSTKYDVDITGEKDIVISDNPFDDLVSLENNYSITKDGIKYGVHYYYAGFYRLLIRDSRAIEREEKRIEEQKRMKEMKITNKKLEDF